MRIFSLQGQHLTLYCVDHTHEWTLGYIDVDKKEGKHILDIFMDTGNVGLEPTSLNYTKWPDTGKPPELKEEKLEAEIKENH